MFRLYFGRRTAVIYNIISWQHQWVSGPRRYCNSTLAPIVQHQIWLICFKCTLLGIPACTRDGWLLSTVNLKNVSITFDINRHSSALIIQHFTLLCLSVYNFVALYYAFSKNCSIMILFANVLIIIFHVRWAYTSGASVYIVYNTIYKTQFIFISPILLLLKWCSFFLMNILDNRNQKIWMKTLWDEEEIYNYIYTIVHVNMVIIILLYFDFYGLAADRQEYCFTTDFF